MVYLLLGPNHFARAGRLRQLVGELPAVRLYASDGLGPWFDSIGQADLFGQSSAVVGYDVLDQLSSDHQQALAAHLTSRVPDDQLVILQSDSLSIVAKSPFQTLIAQSKVETFPSLPPAAVAQWLAKEIEAGGLSIDRPLLPEMVGLFGADQQALRTEVDRLALSAPLRIDRTVLASMVPVGEETSVFGLTDAWLSRQSAEAVRQLQKLLDQNTAPYQILAMLAWQLEILCLAVSAQSESLDPNTFVAQTGLSASALRKASTAARRWTAVQLDQAAISLLNLDIQLKTGGIEPRLGLERWIVSSLA